MLPLSCSPASAAHLDTQSLQKPLTAEEQREILYQFGVEEPQAWSPSLVFQYFDSVIPEIPRPETSMEPDLVQVKKWRRTGRGNFSIEFVVLLRAGGTCHLRAQGNRPQEFVLPMTGLLGRPHYAQKLVEVGIDVSRGIEDVECDYSDEEEISDDELKTYISPKKTQTGRRLKSDQYTWRALPARGRRNKN